MTDQTRLHPGLLDHMRREKQRPSPARSFIPHAPRTGPGSVAGSSFDQERVCRAGPSEPLVKYHSGLALRRNGYSQDSHHLSNTYDTAHTEQGLMPTQQAGFTIPFSDLRLRETKQLAQGHIAIWG